MRSNALTKKARKAILKKRADEAARNKLQKKKAKKFINRYIIKRFPKHMLDGIKIGKTNIYINVHDAVKGAKAISVLEWKQDYIKLVVERLRHKYPNFEYKIVGRKILVTYLGLQSGI